LLEPPSGTHDNDEGGDCSSRCSNNPTGIIIETKTGEDRHFEQVVSDGRSEVDGVCFGALVLEQHNLQQQQMHVYSGNIGTSDDPVSTVFVDAR
jgi:hypothetical protein